jgi:tRNA (mo5U34)-methyltransferase
MTPQELQRRVEAFPFWYHRIELPGGVVTPGLNPLNVKTYGVPDDLGGKRVLDVGAWDGFWSFEALRRGAREVVAIDDFSDFLGQLGAEDRRAWQTFDFCREALGYGADRCRRTEMSVYDVSEAQLGRFDIVFFFGTLYHLRYPLLALDRLAAVCDEMIVVESQICDDYSAHRGGLGRGYPDDHMVMEFFPDDELAGNTSNWWAPSLKCLGHMVRAAGFGEVAVWKLVNGVPDRIGHCRGFARGKRV